MKVIKGKDLVVKLNDKTTYHATQHSFSSSQELETWETKDTDGPQDELKSVSGTASAQGIVCVSEAADSTLNTYDTPSLYEAHLNGETVVLALNIGDNIYTGNAMVSEFSMDAPSEGRATYSATFKFHKLTKKEE